MRHPSLYEALSQAEVICRSENFARAANTQRLLKSLVKKAFGKDAEGDLKEISIGVEHWGAEYDPKKQSSVRVAIKSLREDLEEYYATEGRRDRVVIQIVTGSYVPEIFFNPAIAELSDKAAMNIFNARAAFSKRTVSWPNAYAVA
jgi:hypothetical protein